MRTFDYLTAKAAPLDILNIDTDMIIPKQFLKTIKRTGLGIHVFHEMRTHSDGTLKDDFVLNQPAFAKSEILVTAANFGCGSSREHAPWALFDYGIKCVIAPSFADIFYNNCFENGILPAIITENEKQQLVTYLNQSHNKEIVINLPNQTIQFSDIIFNFDISDSRKRRLLQGLDSIGLTLIHSDKIQAYEQHHQATMPWLSIKA